MRIFIGKLVALAVFATVASASNAATPSHLYELNGSFSDTFGGPALVANGGTLGASSYSFAADQGLMLDSALNANVYTIDTSFNFDSTGGYRRIVDFLDRTSDTGLYNLSTSLNFYNIVNGVAGAFADGQQVRVTVSRDGAGTFSGYVNGALQISFDDSLSNLASFSGTNQRANFFQDDLAVSHEASAGSVDYIAIYARALSAPEVAALAAPVPEPQTYALMLAGLVAVGTMARCRRQG